MKNTNLSIVAGLALALLVCGFTGYLQADKWLQQQHAASDAYAVAMQAEAYYRAVAPLYSGIGAGIEETLSAQAGAVRTDTAQTWMPYIVTLVTVAAFAAVVVYAVRRLDRVIARAMTAENISPDDVAPTTEL